MNCEYELQAINHVMQVLNYTYKKNCIHVIYLLHLLNFRLFTLFYYHLI